MSSPSIAPGRQVTLPTRAVPLSWVLLLALLVHGPLLLMQLPNGSYDADFHKFFAALRATLVQSLERKVVYRLLADLSPWSSSGWRCCLM